MILLAALLGSLGLADLVRAWSRRPHRLWPAAAAAIALFLLWSLGTGQQWWWSPLAASAIIAWLLCTRENPGRRRAGYWALGGLCVVILAAFAWGPLLPPAVGPVVDWYSTLPYTVLHAVPFTTFALAVGGVLFLTETANVIVRLALRGERSATASTVRAAAAPQPSPAPLPARARRAWWRGAAPAKPAAPAPAEPAPTEPAFTEPAFTELKGGRFIGQLERVFLLALVLAGAFTAIAAIVAAKGIIRFPEISKDAAGSKAEYFLVGSFASWALVALVVALVLLGPVA